MVTRRSPSLCRTSVAGVIFSFLGLSPLACWAQVPTIAADRTNVGLATAVNQAGIDYQISGGKVRGDNQFYSFSKLSVPSFGSADFQAANGAIQNMLGRVSGGESSSNDASR